MSPKLVGSLSLLLLGPAASFAQSAPRVYVGASAVLGYAALAGSSSSPRLGPAATLGVQLTPSWAIESGVQFFWQKGSLRTIDASIEENRKTFIVPLLARYTFTDAVSPLQVDVLGGGSWLHMSYRYEYIYPISGGQTVVESHQGATNDAALTLGAQVRYKLGSNFEAKLSLPINLEIDGGGSFSDRLFLTPQLGAQYAFGK